LEVFKGPSKLLQRVLKDSLSSRPNLSTSSAFEFLTVKPDLAQ